MTLAVNTGRELRLKFYTFASTLACHAFTCHNWLRPCLPPSFFRRRFPLVVMRHSISVGGPNSASGSGPAWLHKALEALKDGGVSPLLCETELTLCKPHVKQKAHSREAAVWAGRRYRLSQQHHYRQESKRLPSRLTIDLFSAVFFFFFFIFEINVRQAPCADFNLYLLRKAWRQYILSEEPILFPFIANCQFSTLKHIFFFFKKIPFLFSIFSFWKTRTFKQGPDRSPRAGQWSLPKFLHERPNPSMSLEWDSLTPIPIRARADLYLSDVQTANLAP